MNSSSWQLKRFWSWFDKLYLNLKFCVAITESVNATSKNHFASNAKPSNRTSFYSDVFMTVNQTLAGCCLIINYWSRTLYERNSPNLHARLNHSPVNCTEVPATIKQFSIASLVLALLKNPLCVRNSQSFVWFMDASLQVSSSNRLYLVIYELYIEGILP